MGTLLTAMTMILAQHGDPPAHGSHGGHRKHGNPDDLAGYVAKMEHPDRDAWQKPDAVIDALKVTADSVICDVGAGPGYFALRLARRVRHVYAIDVEPQMVQALQQRIASSSVRNVTPVLALPDDPLLPPASCDLILIVDTFHHFPDGVAYLKRLRGALRPGGRLVNIDFHKRELPVGPKLSHKVAREDFLASAAKAGLELKAEHDLLPYQYFLELQPRR